MGVILEIGLRVDPTVDLDVARRTAGERDCLGDAHDLTCREQRSDAIPRSEPWTDDEPDDERPEADDQEEQGRHGGDDTRRLVRQT
jgi:hypothetical protein